MQTDREQNPGADHHFLARAYLKGFKAKSFRGNWIYQYERQGGDPQLRRVKEVAAERNFYSVTSADGNLDDSVETHLDQTETRALPILHRLVDGQPISAEEKWFFAFFLALQHLRVPTVRKDIEQAYGQMVDQTTKFALGIPGYLEKLLEDLRLKGEDLLGQTADSLRTAYANGGIRVDVDPVTSLHFMGVLSPTVTDCLARMKWVVLKTAGPLFVTSDNPYVIVDAGPRGPLTGGLASPTVEVTFPLQRRALLLITSDQFLVDRYGELVDAGKLEEADRVRDDLQPPRHENATEAVVAQMNERTITYANRYVYSPVADQKIAALLQEEKSRASRLVVENFGLSPEDQLIGLRRSFGPPRF
jgi:hypothetical protein